MRETYQIGPGRIVTVTIEASDAPAGKRLYTAREVGDLQASEAERVATPLWVEINALKNRVKTVSRARREAEEKLARRTEEWDKALDRIRELERLLALGAAREDELEIKKREAIEQMADQLGKVIGAVHGHEITEALKRTHYESAREYQIMAGAIRNVRRVVGSPTPPAVSDATPSQA